MTSNPTDPDAALVERVAGFLYHLKGGKSWGYDYADAERDAKELLGIIGIRELQEDRDEWKAAYERDEKTGISKADAEYLTMRLGEAAESDKRLKAESEEYRLECSRLTESLQAAINEAEEARAAIAAHMRHLRTIKPATGDTP